MGVKVSFRIGNRSGVGDGDKYGIEELMDALGEEIGRKALNNVAVDVHALKTRLDSRISRSIEGAMNFAVMNMVGLPSNTSNEGRAEPTKIFFNFDDKELPAINPSKGQLEGYERPFSIEWQALGKRTIRKKAIRAGNRVGFDKGLEARRFFVDTSSLKNELQQLAKNITTKTGTVRIGYIKNQAQKFNPHRSNQKQVKAGQLQLAFLPQLPLRTLPGLQAGDPGEIDESMRFERALGISPDSLKKLKGIDKYHRPMLQPIFTYWALSRIPRIVAGTISRALVTPKAGNGVEEFSIGTR